MTSGGVLLVLFLLAIGALAGTTLVVAFRGGRGPGDPPASRPHADPAGFFVLSTPRGLFESRPARRMSALLGRWPSPRIGRTSTRLP